ncbi:MAG TPA: hypothetical protein VFL53_20735 [Pseudolabrys sp.]|nr:hypothetical protein [Pseudolabrys sp.]
MSQQKSNARVNPEATAIDFKEWVFRNSVSRRTRLWWFGCRVVNATERGSLDHELINHIFKLGWLQERIGRSESSDWELARNVGGRDWPVLACNPDF